jgi:hypothetical protein
MRGRLARAYPNGVIVGAILVAASCGGGSRAPRPAASLASSPTAAAAFQAVREAWGEPDRTTLPSLRAMLEQFLARFPGDGQEPLARGALALVAMKQGDLPTADGYIARLGDVPEGSARDLATVARAMRLRLQGDPEAGLALLRPLVGKLVDPLARAAYSEELTLCALSSHRDYEAISYMDAWLRATGDDDKEGTIKAVTAIVERLPKDVVLAALQAMRAQRTAFGYGIDIERILGARLVEIASATADAELARLLLDPDAGAIALPPGAAEEMGELATSRRGLNVVEGRTLGLLLPTESPALRDEAADVLRGVMWSLGLPRGVRRRGGTSLDAGAPSPPASAPPCGTLDPAPDLDEPDAREQLRLVTRDDAGSTDRTEVALDELAGEGAAVVIAGLDAQTAARAVAWGESHGVPVVTLVPPAAGTPPAREFGFVLGAPRADADDALVRAAPALADGSVAPVADASEIPAVYPPEGGRAGALTLGPPVSCDIPATRAGEPRFPVAEWDHDRTRAWLVSGSPECASDLVTELTAARARGVVALTLEAAALPPHAPGLRVISAQAGAIPAAPPGDPRQEELQRFSSALGRAGWWTALGRDAATLARVSLRDLPLGQAADPRDVAARRATARDRLTAARARLWTTGAAGFGADHGVTRAVCAIDAPAR